LFLSHNGGYYNTGQEDVSIKVESRGKYPGVKLHLEPEEVSVILAQLGEGQDEDSGDLYELNLKMAKKISKLQEETPGLLDERTPEQVKAILVKEVEKAAMQLKMVEAGQDPSKVDKDKLKEALLKYVKD
jgi:hypothetical protein